MKTHEVEELLGITKQTLIYYEKEGMINPQRNENNYRDYSSEDIDTIKLILLLRDMKVSIDEIKLILNNELSIREVLDSKKQFIETQKEELEQVDNQINEYTKRRVVKISFDNIQIPDWTDNDTLYFNNNYICFRNHQINIDDIQSIDISMCSFNSLMRFVFVFYNYYVDIDICTARDTYSFQIMNDDQILKMFKYIQQHQLDINDPIGLISVYNKYPDKYERYDFIDKHFHDWAERYNLDNPRLNYYEQMEVHQAAITKDKEGIKEKNVTVKGQFQVLGDEIKKKLKSTLKKSKNK